MPTPGDILHYEDFVFDDGTIRNKFFIVLYDDPCLMLITTSNSLRYPMVKSYGCHPEKFTYFFPCGTNPVFPKPTFVVMQRIYELQHKEAKKMLSSRRITKRSPLSCNILNSIKECLKHFHDDISEEHWDLIFSNAPSVSSLQDLANKFNKRH